MLPHNICGMKNKTTIETNQNSDMAIEPIEPKSKAKMISLGELLKSSSIESSSESLTSEEYHKRKYRGRSGIPLSFARKNYNPHWLMVKQKNLAVNNKLPFVDRPDLDWVDIDRTKGLTKMKESNLLLSLLWGDLRPTIILNREIDLDDWYYRKNQIAPLNINEDVVDLYYLTIELNKHYVYSQISKAKKGTTLQYITLSDLLKIRVEIPEIEIQKNLATEHKLELLYLQEQELENNRMALAIEKADEDSRLRHQIIGRLSNAHSAALSISNIFEKYCESHPLDELKNLKEMEVDDLVFQDYIKMLLKDLDHLNTTVEKSRLDETALQLNEEDFEIIPFMNNYCTELKNNSNNPVSVNTYIDFKTTQEIKPRKIIVCGDERLLKQALDNLVENAFFHGFNNQKKSEGKLNVDVLFNLKSNEIQIDFSNNGKPISENFNFEEIVQSKKNKGLPLVNAIVTRHRGSFCYKTADGPAELYGNCGVAFQIVLPIEFI